MEYISKSLGCDVTLNAIVTTPTGFDKSKEKLPMIVFLHGAGERGNDLELIKINGIPKYFCSDPDYLGLRVITVSPQCPDGYVWPNLAYQLKDFITSMIEEYNVDPDMVSITGLSMGGFGTWEMICLCPELFSAAAPICGGGLSWRIETAIPFPIYAFHDKNDCGVPFVYSQMMVNAVNNMGGNAILTAFEGCQRGGHDSWTPAYETTDLIKKLATAVRK